MRRNSLNFYRSCCYLQELVHKGLPTQRHVVLGFEFQILMPSISGLRSQTSIIPFPCFRKSSPMSWAGIQSHTQLCGRVQLGPHPVVWAWLPLFVLPRVVFQVSFSLYHCPLQKVPSHGTASERSTGPQGYS